MDIHDLDLPPAEIADLARRIDRPVVLVGMMGVGKSSVGKRLAAVLNCPFYDADDEIEKAARMPIPAATPMSTSGRFTRPPSRPVCAGRSRASRRRRWLPQLRRAFLPPKPTAKPPGLARVRAPDPPAQGVVTSTGADQGDQPAADVVRTL